uniref:Uncharacterized protein n=1 Tax=Oryza glumipatula TaxID=40148 RepID=A0A0D9YQH3_9ORYZ
MQKVVPFLRRSILAPFPFPSLSSFFFFTGVFALSCGAEEASQHSLRAKKRRIQRRQADPGAAKRRIDLFRWPNLADREQVWLAAHHHHPPSTDLKTWLWHRSCYWTFVLRRLYWARSAISSLHTRWSGTQDQRLQDEVLQLQSGLQLLKDTLPAMYDLIDRAEWRSHEDCVTKLLPNLKDAVYNADDLLDEFRWYEQKGFVYDRMGQLHLGTHWEHEVRLMKNFNQFYGDLKLSNLGALSKYLAAEIKLNRKRYIGSLTLQWCLWISQEHNEMEVFQVLHPPTSLRSLKLMYYPGESLPCWFQEQNGCNEIAGVIANNNNGCISIFSSLTYLDISDCEKLSNLNQFLQVAHVPSLERIRISNCGRVASTPRFGDFHFLEELILDHCKIFDHSESLSIPSLKKLVLLYSGNPISKIECRSLTSLSFVCPSVTSIPLQVWSSNLPALQNLDIKWCPSLTFIGESEPADFTNLSHQVSSSSSRIRTFSSLTVLTIHGCEKLLTLDDLLKQEYLPFIKSIKISYCQGLLSLPGEICLENVTSLVILRMIKCRGITSITDQTLSSNLASLQELCIEDCPDLVSIGRGKLIAKLKKGGMAGKIG